MAAMLVQIYEVRSPADAHALVGLGVDHIGVLVGDGAFPRELGGHLAREIFAAVASPARRVALSLSADPAAIARIVEDARPDILHLDAAVELLAPETAQGLKTRFPQVAIMRSIPIVDRASFAHAEAYRGIADFLLLDSHQPGDAQIGALGRTHDWTISRRLVAVSPIPVILAGGLGPENVAAAIAAVRPAGVDSKTATDRPDGGGKDLDLVRRFVAAAKFTRKTPSP
jgi:phosphoribosylanthranilate isomerase